MQINPDSSIRLTVQPGWTLVDSHEAAGHLVDLCDCGTVREMYYQPPFRRPVLSYLRLLVESSLPYEFFFYGVEQLHLEGDLHSFLHFHDVELHWSTEGVVWHDEIQSRLRVKAHRLLWRAAPAWAGRPVRYLNPDLPLEVADPLGMYLHEHDPRH